MKSSAQRTPGEGEQGSMSIGELAAHFGLATHVLRHWEARGLLAPARDAAGRRRYRTADLTRVAVVLRAKEAGLSLDAIRSLTGVSDAEERRSLLREEAEALRSRIAAAQASLALVECALGCEHEDITQCAHFQRAVRERVGRDAAVAHAPAE
ncbi:MULTISPECIES: MerR family transcriptional regulator [Streptomyces]|uniref:MerR family transcriptional regulator n=1 Tax=Streptomyces TaxID=1883 RepID=UPI000835060F|nr:MULTISPECIES: MerR family transcriptional regulator [Streptomyces]MDN5385096.1 MerR family transcriptional regulator [Streptomyces sp. LB8]